MIGVPAKRSKSEGLVPFPKAEAGSKSASKSGFGGATMIGQNYSRFGLTLFLVFVGTSLLHVGTFSGLDSDFQAYALFSKLIYNGQTPYVDFFTHKPPLYSYLLLPGNLLGGRLISFFILHLIYVSLVNCLVFYIAATLTKKFSLFRGVCAWLLFSMVTVVQFFSYGNLNGSIVYVSLGFSLITFLLLLRIKERMEEGQSNIGHIALAAGVFSSLSLLTRFGVAQNFVFIVLICYLLFVQKVSWKDIFTLVVFYGTGFLVPVVIMLVVLGFPFKELYEQLIVFNSLMALNLQNLETSSTFLLSKAILGKLVGYGGILLRYTWFLVIICFVAFFSASYNFLKAKQEENKKLAIFSNLNKFLNNSVAPWLIIYFIAELFMVSLQGTWAKEYPFFPVFAPLSLLTSLSAVYFTTLVHNQKLMKQLLLWVIVLVFVFRFGFAFYGAAEKLTSVLNWPESQLIGEIKRNIRNNHDLFTLDFQAYIYLETGTIPPKGRYGSYIDWQWNFWGSKPDMERDLWQQLESNPPTVVTRRKGVPVPDSAVTFMSKYRKAGTFPASYRGDTILYILKEANP